MSYSPHTPRRTRGRPRGRPPGSKNRFPRSAPPQLRGRVARRRRGDDDDDDDNDDDIIKAQDITFDDDDDIDRNDDDEDDEHGEEDDDDGGGVDGVGQDEDDENGFEAANHKHNQLRQQSKRKRRRRATEDATNDDDENDDVDVDDDVDEDDDDGAAASKDENEDGRVAAARKARAARMRAAKASHNAYAAVPLDADGNPQVVENDEIVVPIDPEGELKVNQSGHLADGRDYRCRTFTVLGKGDRLYMLSTEPARCCGFRDSYLFFQRHRRLLKVIIDDKQKFDLIDRHLIPHSYKGRAIGVVTARSVFREFGARIVVGGRRVIDDYAVSLARQEGAIEGQLADPDDKLPPPGTEYNRNQYVAWHGASSVYHTAPVNQPVTDSALFLRDHHMLNLHHPLKKKTVVITDENWMLEHARAASNYNSFIAAQRKKIWLDKGSYEPHTGIVMVPANSQSTVCVWERVDDSNATAAVAAQTKA
ncbi:chromatin remodelling complex Rsc7/Swp82 subunit-domain-containing protein [Lipomyces japonicus]|uniref:chromatin remodelling complex Rsc7/Swp82 subunit-domain-containing protein n=1 Tax=Lipomyces japonicus TaxID=56871 RepID=UPI0034CD545C